MTETRPLGQTGLEVSRVCIGTSPLADMPQLYGYGVDEERAVETVIAALRGPFNFIDTSNGYGDHGESEVRIGEALRRVGGLPSGYVLATKVDPAPGSTRFDGDRVRASLEESLERLGVDRIQLLYLHDPERMTFEAGIAPGGALDALVALRDEGIVGSIGVAGGSVGLLRQYVSTGVLDVVLNHNRFTLLDRSAEPLIEDCLGRQMGFVNAAPYGGGMLVKGPSVQTKYAYGDRDELIGDRARAMQDACAEYGIPLAAAALQFSTRSPSIDSTVVGMSTPERIAQTTELLAWQVPDELWERLAELTPPRDYWLD